MSNKHPCNYCVFFMVLIIVVMLIIMVLNVDDEGGDR